MQNFSSLHFFRLMLMYRGRIRDRIRDLDREFQLQVSCVVDIPCCGFNKPHELSTGGVPAPLWAP